MRFTATMHQFSAAQVIPPRYEAYTAPDVIAALEQIVDDHRVGQDGSLWTLSCPPVVTGDLGYVSFASADTTIYPHRSFFVKPAPLQAVHQQSGWTP